ncbi:hypothetical protein [Halorarius halobius]|uniref:hypothetical protein n=1 Tax=Halorarius halobius TaxID=2962671 RepID=UPI0020CC6076|nr:hypothetical protein [Halorarius halobius]
MVRCGYDGCGWCAIAPTERAAREQYADHLVAEHAREVDADLPAGTVQVRHGDDAEWRTVPVEEALGYHDKRSE